MENCVEMVTLREGKSPKKLNLSALVEKVQHPTRRNSPRENDSRKNENAGSDSNTVANVV